MNFGHIKKIHFVGIGGIGMSGIAEILTNYQLSISGCDLKASPITERLARSGIRVLSGHDPAHVEGADLVVISSAVHADNAEVLRARELKIPVIRRAEMLGEIMRLKRAVAVAGTHGKTTTSAMNAAVLQEAGLDPTLIVGGVMRNLATNALLGQGEYLVVEADEFDRSFLALDPTFAVITNIEADHLDCYADLDDIRGAFTQFACKVPFFGAVIACIDDPNVAGVLQSVPKRIVTYGLSESADVRGHDLRYGTASTRFEVTIRGTHRGAVELRAPGAHNVRNALAAIAVADEIGIPFETAGRALSKFGGVERRFQILGEYNGALVVDDYAHHPTEISATIQAARAAYPNRRLVVLFQPHLFTRTRDFHADFARALSGADVALVMDIYPAREAPIAGVTSAMVTDVAAREGWRSVTPFPVARGEAAKYLGSILKADDVFVTMGAGDVNGVAEELAGVVR